MSDTTSYLISYVFLCKVIEDTALWCLAFLLSIMKILETVKLHSAEVLHFYKWGMNANGTSIQWGYNPG